MSAARSAKKKVRVLLADREGVFRLGLKKLFAVEDDLRVVAQAESAVDMLQVAQSLKPNLVFVQADIVAEGRGDIFGALQRASPRCKVVVTASALGEEDPLRYVKSGASGVIPKTVDPTLFVKCARRVMDDEVWLPKRQATQPVKPAPTADEQLRRPVETLTRREKMIISYLMEGWRNREIANHLSISEQTVKNHLRAIYDKVGVSDRLELVLYAIHQHLELPEIQPAVAQA